MSGMSHLDEQGRARMVDVSGKPETAREAVAEALVTLAPATRQSVFAGDLP
ncbi:MAG: moaC, partial [Acidobacteria bacterium]|nr:moaC [Acidobacteriota bacterium]